MDEHGKAPGGLDLKPIFNALIILLLTGIFVQQLPLGSGRPLPDKDRRPAAGIKLDARLWTDPFEAPRRDQGANARHATNFGDFGGQVAARILGAGPAHKVFVLPVMVDGGPYFESIEARRRTRYAVVSGLAAAGYEPEDAESIHYLNYPDPFQMYDPLEQIVLSAAERQFPDIVPYEWFRPVRAAKDVGGTAAPALVLWLEENRFGGRPLEKLGALANQLRYSAMRSVYRVASPEQSIGDYRGCSGTEHRPPLVEEEFAKLFVQERLTDPDTHAFPERLWGDLLNLLRSDLPKAGGLSSYLRLLPLALWLRSDARGQSDLEALRKELPGLIRDARTQTGKGGAAPGQPRAADAFSVRCDVPYDSFLFQLLRHRTTDFLDALGERLRHAAAGAPTEFFLMPGIPAADPAPLFTAASYEFHVLGPASSNLLKQMLSELADLPRGAGPDGRNRYYPFRFYSAGASAEELLLLKPADLGKCQAPQSGVQCAFERKGLSFIRTIATDDRLAESVRHELRLRGVPIGSENHPIVLIAEWDRVYTQKLRESFCSALRSEEGITDCTASLGSTETVMVYSYLRGLDGEGAQKLKPDLDDPAKRSGGSSKSGDMAKSLLAGGASYPWGDDQVDYLQRMAEDLKKQEVRLRAGPGGGSIRAIGLLGSDVYDKLLILRALKPQFPEARFFTTDLDARLLKGMLDDGLTQNLIVVSSWGLQLHPAWQRDIPPFRSSYQTSYFLAAQIAMKPLTWQRDCVPRLELEPQIFEVGRTRFVELPSADRGAKPAPNVTADCTPGMIPDVLDVVPPPGPTHQRIGVLWVGLLAGLLVIACMTRAACVRFADVGEAKPLPRALVTRGDLMLFVAMGTWALVTLNLFVASNEPFALTEGVSIWPTELIRATAFLMTVFYFWPRSLCWLKPLRAELALHGMLVMPTSDWTPKGVRHYAQNARFWAALALFSAAVVAVQVGAEYEVPVACLVAIPLLLAAYAIVSSLRSRLWIERWTDARTAEMLTDDLYRQSVQVVRDQRIRVFMVAFLGVSLALMLAFGLPLAPFRDAGSQWADRLVLVAAIIAYLGLLAVVIDTTRLVNGYLRQLADVLCFGCADAFAARWGMERSLAERWLKVQWVGIVTKHVSRLIVYPFVIAAMLALARNRLFDDWSVPLGLILVFALGFGYLLFCAWSLKKVAGIIRDRELAELRVLATRAKHAGHDAEAGKINDVLGKIESYREGSYASIFQRPIFRGLLLLAGGGSADFLAPMIFSQF